MTILLNNHGYDNSNWQAMLSQLLPEREVVLFSELTDQQHKREAIEYALVWDHPRGDLAHYPNLKGILLLGAGTESIDRDPEVPDVPVVRLIDPAVMEDMARYCLHWVIQLQRQLDRYRDQQQVQHWQRHDCLAAAEFKVCVLGLGEVGAVVAQRLASNGYPVSAWSRSQYQLEGVTCFSAQAGLNQALQDAQVLINCLPASEQTRRFIDRGLLERLPTSATLINISRASVIDTQQLLQLLDEQKLAGAILDVFEQEPLPEQHPLWHHPKVTVTPHAAGATYPRSAAHLVVDNIRRIEAGQTPFPLYAANKESS